MKKSFTRLIAMLLVVALCGTMLPMAMATETQTATFKDVGPTHWAYAYVEQAVADGLFQGITEDTFAPNMTMNRAMFVTVLSRMAGVEVDNEATANFTDVPAGKWYTGAVAWAVAQGITTGMSAEVFNPTGDVTRQQAATFLYRYMKSAGLELPEGTVPTFTDAEEIDSYALEAMEALAAAGIITGYDDGTVRPDKVLTRAEAAALFVRFSQLAAPPRMTYSVNFMAPHVTVTVDGAETTFCAVEQGSDLVFMLEAEEGYAITSVSTADEVLTPGEDGSYVLADIQNDTVVTVVAESTAPETFLVTFEAENAQVFVDGEAVTEALAEGELTFAVEAAEGYEIHSVTASTGTLTDNGDGTYTLAELTESATVYVVATEKTDVPTEPETYTITFVTDEGVVVYVDGEAAAEATVTAEQLPFTFGVSMVAEHTQVAAAEVSPAGELYFTGNAYMLTGITGDTTVTLTTGPEMLDVAFYTPVGATPVETVQVAYGEYLELPEDPTMEGYFFGGWYTDKDLFYDFLPETPITEDMVLFGGFGQVVDVVHYDSINGSNSNDGATKETSVISMSWALKLAEHSTTKSIIMHYAAPVITNVTEIWDASHIEGGITVYMDPETYTEQGTWAIYTTTGNLTVKNMHFVCEDAEEFKGACFLYNYSAYDNVAQAYTYGNTTLIDCTATGFGNLPTIGSQGFYNAVIYNLGTLTMIGGEYYGNSSPSGTVDNYHGYSNFYADGVYFHDNRSTYNEEVWYGSQGQAGAIWVNCWVAEIKNCTFENNWSARGGGAIAFGTISELVIENCTFIGNSTDADGGAIKGLVNSKLVLGEGNIFKNNTASGMGGAVFSNMDITLTQGIFEGNTANQGNDVYGLKAVTLAPIEGSDLAVTGGITAAGGVKISATLANLEQNVVLTAAAVSAGTTIATGVGYTLTEADLAKITVVPTAELVLDTERNVIKVKELGGGDSGATGPVEEEMEGPHNLSAVYLGAGSDNNDGTTASNCVASFGKAKSLLAPDGIIYICGQVVVTGEKMWSLDPEEFGSAKVMRAPNYNGVCVSVRGNLTLHDIVIDGGNNKASTYFMGCNGSGVTLTLGEGCVIRNVQSTGYYGAVANGSGGDTVIIDGATITNCSSSGYYGGMVYAPVIIMKAGEISNITRSGYYGGAALNGKSVTMLGGEIHNITSTDSYGAVLFAQSSGSITMNGGKIYNNSANYILGHMGNAPMEVDGGEIYGNSGTAVIGTMYTGGDILLGNVKIYNNTCSASAIKIPGNSTVTVSGAEITGNKGNSTGGGIYASGSNTYLKLLSGKISGNTASVGDDLYISNQKTLTVTPTASGLEIGGEIFLRNSSASYFGTDGNTVGDLTNLIGTLQFNFSKLESGTVVATPDAGYTFTEADLAKFGCFGCNISYEINAAGKIVTKAKGLESVSLDKTELTVMATYTDKLIATVGPADASSTNLTWKSSNTAVAKVSGSQLSATVTGVAPGTAIITACAADNSQIYAECVVTVTKNTTTVQRLTLNRTTHSMRVEQSVSLSATITPSNAANQNLVWTVSDPTLVQMTGSSKSVTLKALAAGEVTVTATTTDGTNLSASCVITIEPRVEIESITLNKTEHRMDDGETVSLTATVTPSDAWNTTVTWTSSNTAVAKVSGSTGKTVTVTAVADGNAVITATTADGKTATCAITVADLPVTGLTIEADSDMVAVGDTIGVTAMLEPANAANQKVIWTSSDETVATVHVYGSNAVVYGVSPGEVTITATSDDGGFTGEVTVTVTELEGNYMELDLTNLDLIVHQSFNITAMFEREGQQVTWTTSNSDIVDILSTTDNQVTIKCGGIVGSAVITATAADGQTATCAVNVEGRISGTLDEVYVSTEGSDSNDGATEDTPVRSLMKAISLLGVDGTIYVKGRNVSLPANANITLPKEIYGNAKIVMVHTHEEVIEELPWGPEIREECYAPTFLLGGRAYFSDVTISWEQGGSAMNIIGGNKLDVVISNGAHLIGGYNTDRKSQSLAYVYGDSRLLVNGGEIEGFGGASQVIWVRERGQATVNGGHFHDNYNNYLLNIDGNAVELTINGGTFESEKTVISASHGNAYINGGRFVNHKTGGTIATNNAMLYSYEGYTTIDPKYPMAVENYGIYHGTRYAETYLGSLHNLEGTLGFSMTQRDARPGTTCFYGTNEHTLTWEDFAKVHMPNYTLELDQAGNCIVIQ